jgi:hypothetical protein
MNKIDGGRYSFSTSAQDGEESARFMPRPVNPRYLLDRKLGNPGTRLQVISTLKKGKAITVNRPLRPKEL